LRIFEAERAATLEDVSWLRKAIARALEDLRLATALIEDMQLVMSEIGANIVTHGEPPATLIAVSIDIAATGLTIEIIDDGGAFADFHEAINRVPAPSFDDMEAISGRGLGLVRDALNHVEYVIGDRNHFTGRRSLGPIRPTVLVVEDSSILQQIYRGYLKAGYKTIGCSSLEEARVALRDCHVDIVLADVHLGDGLGTAIAHDVETIGSHHAPPVVLISSDTSAETRELALRLGAEFFVGKPVRASVMRDTINLALTRAVMRRARLVQSFARDVDKLVSTPIPNRVGAYRAKCASGTASTGGGDLILHWKRKDGDRLVLVDVMGHGIAAKAWAIAYASIIRTLNHCHPDLTAFELLTELADFAWKETALEHIMATVLIVDLDSEGATVASAGHPAPLLVRHVVHPINVVGPLLGVMPPTPYVSAMVALHEGDRVALITDGVDPMTVASGDETPTWLRNILLSTLGQPFDQAFLAISEAAAKTLGPQPEDDWTIVLLEKISL
jgi:DNA-binding response OmpR family regulator/anti-sigma regulatory factor (Ser/Thr protein kinase)